MAATLALAGFSAADAQTAWPPSGRLAFDVWRGGKHIGRHTLVFKSDGDALVVSIDALIRVGFGPLTLFQYSHQATETWRSRQFMALQSHTVTNGRTEWLDATRSADAVVIKTQAGSHGVPPASLPLTHWNQQALAGPLFNPQTGAPIRHTVTRQDGQSVKLADGASIAASRMTLAGEVQIIDWYDARGVWAGLRARAQDGSYVDYKRLV